MGNGKQITVNVERPDEKSFADLKVVIQTADLSAGMLDIYTKPEYAIKQQKLLDLMLERILDIRHRDFDVEQCADELIQALEATD